MSSQTDNLLRWFGMIGNANQKLTEEGLGPESRTGASSRTLSRACERAPGCYVKVRC
jgi:hypothetical protein